MNVSNKSINLGIIGAGIGGLALSVLLRNSGYQVCVFEKSNKISEFGAGIQLSPNGVKILRKLGIEDEIIKYSSNPQRIVLKSFKEEKFFSQIILGSTAAKRYSAQFLQIHRPDLIEILYKKACDCGVTFNFGKSAFVKVSFNDRAVISCDGFDVEFDAVVAADGIHSATRKKFFKYSKPVFLKQAAYRVTVPLEKIENSWKKPEVKILVGPGRHVVIYPLSVRSLLNVVFCIEENRWTAEGWSNNVDPDEISKEFENFRDLHNIWDQITNAQKWGLFGYKNEFNWYHNNVALLGDSCHPMLPYLAQGANQALEDAAALSFFLVEKSALGFSNSFKFYGEYRQGRVAKVQKAAQRNAKIYHLSNIPTTFVLHKSLKFISNVYPNFLLSRFDWLYDYEIPN